MAVNYDRAMIDLVREIRRRVSSEAKPGIKLANPEILNELAKIYFETQDPILEALIKELFARAGDPWPALLEQPGDGPQYQTKVYRGQATLVEKPSSDGATKPKAKRMYRGQEIPG